MASKREIIIQLRDTLARLVEDPNRVIVLADRTGRIQRQPPIPNLNGNKDIILHVRGLGVDTGSVAAAGRHNTYVRLLVDIVARSRNMADQAWHDFVTLTDTDVGHFEFEKEILNALQMWRGDPKAATLLLMIGEGEPIRLVNGSSSVRELFAQDSSWVSSVLTFEIIYREDLVITADNQ